MANEDKTFITNNINNNDLSADINIKKEDINYEDIVNSMSCGSLIINYSTTITFEYANDYFFNLLGYSREEYNQLFNNSITARIYPDDIQRLRAAVSRQLSMSGDIRYEFRIIKKDGSIAWVLLNGKKRFSDSMKIYASLVDISEMKNLYNIVAEKNLELDTIYHNIQGGIIKLCITDLRVTSANDGFYKLIGYTKEEFLHLYNNILSELVHTKDLDSLNEFASSDTYHSELTLRIIGKGDKLSWLCINASRIGSSDGKPIYLCTLFDVTDNKSYERNLELSQKKQQLLTQMSGELVWEYNYSEKRFTRGHDQTGILKNKDMKEHYRTQLTDNNFIHPDDKPIYIKFCDDLEKGSKFLDMEIRVINGYSGNYSWYRTIGKTLYDKDNNPITIIGKTYNTDETHETINALTDKTNHDSLTTGIYNRNHTEYLIQEKIKSDKTTLPYALILADIDNFRKLNESLGHLFGDSLLQEIASIFKKLCPTDIIGRVGADIFAIFIDDVKTKELIDTLIDNINIEINKIYNTNESPNISVSYGIAYCNIEEYNYEVLFRKADVALFSAKSKDRGYSVYYDDSLGYDSSTSDTLNEYNVRDGLSLVEASMDTALITSAIDLLFDSSDTLSAVKILMTKIKKHFNCDYVSLVSLKENRSGGYNVKGMWIPNKYRINIRTMPKELVEQHHSLFNKDNLFYCSDINTIDTLSPAVYEYLSETGSKSVLQAANINKDKYVGYLCLSKCEKQMTWTPNQVRTLSILSKIIFSAIGKLPLK